jgi:hypothetical protein
MLCVCRYAFFVCAHRLCVFMDVPATRVAGPRWWHREWENMSTSHRMARLLALHKCFDGPPGWYTRAMQRYEAAKMRAEDRKAERDRNFQVGSVWDLAQDRGVATGSYVDVEMVGLSVQGACRTPGNISFHY